MEERRQARACAGQCGEGAHVRKEAAQLRAGPGLSRKKRLQHPRTNTLSPPRPCCALPRAPCSHPGRCVLLAPLPSAHTTPGPRLRASPWALPSAGALVLSSAAAALPHITSQRGVMADVATQPLPQQQPPAPAPAAAEAQSAEPAKAEPAKPSFEDDPKAALKAGLEETDEQILFSCGCTGGQRREAERLLAGQAWAHIHGCTHAGVCLAGGPLHRRPPWTHLSPCASTCRPAGNICYDLASEPVVTLCGHLYCWPCLYRWLQVQSHCRTCPVCKAGVEKDKVRRVGVGRG